MNEKGLVKTRIVDIDWDFGGIVGFLRGRKNEKIHL